MGLVGRSLTGTALCLPSDGVRGGTVAGTTGSPALLQALGLIHRLRRSVEISIQKHHSRVGDKRC